MSSARRQSEQTGTVGRGERMTPEQDTLNARIKAVKAAAYVFVEVVGAHDVHLIRVTKRDAVALLVKHGLTAGYLVDADEESAVIRAGTFR